MRNVILKALHSHANGHIQKHLANIEIYLNNPAGTCDVGDIIETIELEIQEVAKYMDQLDIISMFLDDSSASELDEANTSIA